MHDQNLIGVDLEKACQGGHRFARQVHKGLGFEQPNRLALKGGARHQAVVAAVHYQRGFERARGAIDKPETGVVAGGVIVGAGIAQANEELDHGVLEMDCGRREK